jgi:putative transposase
VASDFLPQQPVYKQRLYHGTPSWVQAGEVFHIRIRAAPDSRPSLTKLEIAKALLQSVDFYERQNRWFCHVFLVMPDHLHALLAFPNEPGMSRTIAAWKAFHTRFSGIRWQTNYFDHRIRNSNELELKCRYIRANPVARGLCAEAVEWPWVIGRLHAEPG